MVPARRSRPQGRCGLRRLRRESELYATAAIAGAAVYLLAQGGGVAPTPSALLGMATVAVLRFAAILWRLRLPVFKLPDEDA